MNKWKVAFFALAGTVLLSFVWILYLATSPADTPEPLSPVPADGSVVVIQTTAAEFEAIAKQYLSDAFKKSPLEIDIAVRDQIYLQGDFVIFGIKVPIQMDFEPIVHEGNIRLKQTALHLGKLKIPPEAVLKILKDAVDFPDWVTVRPNEEEIYVDLSRLKIAEGSRVRAKEIDLPNDKILLEVIIPNN